MPTYTAEPSGNGGRSQGVLTAVFLLLAVVLLNLSGPGQRTIQAALRASVLRPFVWTQETLLEARDLAATTAALRDTLAAAAAVSATRTHLVEENRRLRALLSLSERLGPSWATASVIRSGTAGSESAFQLNVGADDGVVVNAPIVTRHGLVGVVREVGPRTAVGMDWTHPEFRASAMDSAGEAYGLVEARRGVFREEDRLQFT
ncbi:MAG TPA: rod shape-determining protein MreC, partial [Longimicrobiales bacterium]|nr:rod shape-determining protein MreC [Longimicrobiales bacterium]